MFQRTRNYAKDYQRVGKSVRYTGKHYRLDLEQPGLNRRKAAYLLLLICAAGLYVAAGLSGAASFGAAGKPAAIYVVLPYIVLLLPLGLAIGRAFLLAVKTKPMEYGEYDKYLVQQRGVLFAALGLCACLILGNLAFLVSSAERGMRELMSFFTALLLGGCIFAAFLQYRALFSRVVIDESSGVLYD